MPIRKRIETRGALAFIEHLEDKVANEQRAFIKEQTDIMAVKLHRRVSNQAPPRRGRWAGWSNNPAANRRARRWWFAAIRRGAVPTDGSHYRRTGNIATIWEFLTETVKGGYMIIVQANNRALDALGRFRYRWVLGTFEQRNGSRWQVPGHRDTGWPLIDTVVRELFEDFDRATKDFIKGLTSSIRNR